MNQENKVVKISDVVQNQIPEFIVADNPNFVEFLNQYYISQEFQGSNVDLIENLISYKDIDSFDRTNLISDTSLTSAVGISSTIINVQSTKGWPAQYGLLKIDNEVITYTGITSTSFTGCIRGFSGISSLSQENNPEVLLFSDTQATSHTSGSVVHNLSNLFLKEFFKKIKYQFTPGFEEREFDSKINPQNFISKVKSFYQTKGTNEAFSILFKVLYAEDVKVIRPNDYCFTPSDDKWRTVETFVCQLISGNPFNIDGQSLYQDKFIQSNINEASGSIYDVQLFKNSRKDFYKLQIFSGHSNNLNPKGSISGTFVPTPKTFVVENVSSGSSVITVDSTVGFSNSGTLQIGSLTISYTNKTNSQFLGCSGVTSEMVGTSEVFSDHYVYAYDKDTSEVVKFRLFSVLSKYENSDGLFLTEGDPIKVDSLGSTEDSKLLNSLVYNLPTSIFVGKVVSDLTPQIRSNQKEGLSLSTGNVLCKFPHYLRTGDLVNLYLKTGNVPILTNSQVTVINSKEFLIPVGSLPQNILGKKIIVRRLLKKSPYGNLGLCANIQDSYVDDDSYYLTTNGLPDYQINPFDFTTTFFSNIPYALDSFGYVETYFKTGDEVSIVDYTGSAGFRNDVGLATGRSYFVTRINNFQVRLSESRENVGVSSYISFFEYNSKGNFSAKITNIELARTSHYDQQFKSGKLFKKFPKNPKIAEVKTKTSPGSLGIFRNGIELRNYKSYDKMYYGPIESVTVLNSGSGYDLNNPPKISVENGNTTNIIPNLKGNIIKVVVEDSGFDYIETPTVSILGGNNSSVVTEVKMKNVFNEVKFNATTKDTVIDTVNDVLKFKSAHRFVTGEPIIYKNYNSTSIGIGTVVADGSLINDSIYYAVNIGAGTSMRLAFNKNDALQGINLIPLRTYGGGSQSFISAVKKQAIDQVNILQSEGNFEYKKLSFLSQNVNTLDNIITIKDHGFSAGEEVVYSFKPLTGFNGGPISGLSTQTYYYIDKIDDDSFKLSSTKDILDYIDLTSADDYTTYFIEYSPIRAKISGALSVSGITTVGYAASLTALIQGSVIGAHVQQLPNLPGIIDVFGSQEICNWEDDPKLTIIEGSGASFSPLIVDGIIKKVIVKSSGSGYYNTFSITAVGDGFGAKLYPVISNGQITDVVVDNGGINYSPTNTKIIITPVGNDAKLKANIKSWTINGTEKYGFNTIEDGLLFGKNYSLFGKSYGVYHLNQKLRNFFSIPNTPTEHSPIVGWAYDGCPIYGPYAFTNADGTGPIIRMRSGYAYQNTTGIAENLVEEYYYSPTKGTLDKYNGRYCVTPEYPKGVYAYFCTFDQNNVPEFPYAIGPEYNFTPIGDDFDLKKTQEINFNNLDIVKWTTPYRIEDYQLRYEYFEFYPNQNDDDVIVEKSSSGSIDEIKILDGGDNYQVGDSVVFDNQSNDGFGAIAKVSEISGVGITTISTQTSIIPDFTFVSNGNIVVGIATTYHSLKNGSYVTLSGISTSTFSSIEGIQKISIGDISSTLSVGVGSATNTGIVTSIKISDRLDYFDIDSQLVMNGEIVKVIGKDYKNNLLNILRPTNGISHLQSESITLLPNKFQFTSTKQTPNYNIRNDSYYFYSAQSVSIGQTASVGLGNTLSIYPLGIGLPYTSYVQYGGIYLPNNPFDTGDKIVYIPGATSIVTNKGDLSSLPNLYVIKISNDVIGIVTFKSDISNIDKVITYTSSGSSDLHKFTTDRSVVKGNIKNISCVVSTASTHGLHVNDVVDLKVTSGITTTYVVTFDSNRVKINSQTNPKINLYSNDTIVFDLTSPTLSGKTFNLYEDKKFLNPYIGNQSNGIEVSKTSTQLVLNISQYTPKTLYYNLTESITDISIEDHNQLIINDSLYNFQTKVFSLTDTSFTVNLNTIPERLSYTSGLVTSTNSSTLSYSVLSENVSGSISKIELVSKGSNYTKLPQVLEVSSDFGSGASLFANSYSIGKIQKAKVNNTSLICPFDKTIKPKSNLSSIKLIDNYYVKSLNIISQGSNYTKEPKIKLYNKKDNQLVSNFSAAVVLKNSSVDQVQILNPGFGLKSSDNKIVSIDNENGLKIINALITGSSPYVVTLTVKTPISGFTTSNPLPISIGDQIFVEGMVSDGFNSSQNDYDPFVVTGADPAYGSQDAATIQYQIYSNPGSYSNANSYNAYVIPYSYLPKIEAQLEQNKFSNKEYISDDQVQIISNTNNDPITNLIKTKNSKNVSVGSTITGKSSQSRGKVIEVDKFNFYFGVDSSVSEILGGFENRGYLSTNIQKLSDNDYYQKFSYSLKSKKDFSVWNSPVSDIAHISGYKKFSDLSVESLGIGSSIKTSAGVSNLLSINAYADVNSIHDYDLVQEIDLDDTNNVYSQYLKFGRISLGNSLKSTDNRVLSIDDISNLFINQPTRPSIPIDNIISSSSNAIKYEFYLTATNSFLGEFTYPEIFELLVCRSSDTINLTGYSYYYDSFNLGTNAHFGEFIGSISPTGPDQVVLSFQPTNPFLSIDIKAIKETVPSVVGMATTSFGYGKNVEFCQQYGVGIASTSVIYTIPVSDCNSGTLIIGISSIKDNIESAFEASFVNTPNGLFISNYTEAIYKDLGTIGISTNGSNIELTYTTSTGIGVTVQGNLKLLTNTYAGYNTLTKNLSIFESSKVTTTSLSSGISTVSGNYGYTKYLIEIVQNTGISTNKSIVQLNSIHYQDYMNNVLYNINGTVDQQDLNFETQYNIVGNTYTLYFNPITPATYTITTYESSLTSPIQ